MAQVCLTGPGWTSTLVDVVVGLDARSVSQQDAVVYTDEAAERAIYFADIIGFSRSLEEVGAQSTVTLTANADLDAKICETAAREVMTYFGRVPSQIIARRRQMVLSRAAARVAAGQAPSPTSQRSATGSSSVVVASDKVSHEGFFLTRTYQLRHPRFDGGMSDLLDREVFQATDAALVLPYDVARDRVLLVEQFRLGPFGREDPYPWVLEPVAGRIDAGETPEDAALRECTEEADLAVETLYHISSHYCSPGCSTEFYHCYLGIAQLPSTEQKTGGVENEHEDIRRHVISFDAAMDLMRSGEINIGPLFLMLLWLERERPRLRALA